MRIIFFFFFGLALGCKAQEKMINKISVKSLEKRLKLPVEYLADSCYSTNNMFRIEIGDKGEIKDIQISDNADNWMVAELSDLIKSKAFNSIEESAKKNNIRNTSILIPVFIYSDLSYKCENLSKKTNLGLFTFNNKLPEGNTLFAGPVDIIYYVNR